MQIKTTMSYHIIPVSMAIIKETKDNKCWQPLYTVDMNVNWYSHSGKQYGGSSKTIKNRATIYPPVSLLSIYIYISIYI
jgi:hypothetical protein